MTAFTRTLLALSLPLTLSACTMFGTNPPVTPGPSGTTLPIQEPIATNFSFAGHVAVPADLISNNAGGLISNNAGGLISNNAGGLISNNAGGYRIAALSEQPLARALVYFLNPDDTFFEDSDHKQLLTMTDDQGHYGLTVKLEPNVPVIVSALITGNQRLVGYTVTKAGKANEVNLSVASTYVTEFLRQQSAGRMQDYPLALENLPALVAQTQVLLDLGLLRVPDLTIGHAEAMNQAYLAAFTARSQALSDLWKTVLGRRVLGLSTVAGTYYETMDQDPALVATQKGLAWPTGVAVDGSGSIYVACQNAHVIRKVTTDGRQTVIGAFKGDGSILPPMMNLQGLKDGVPFSEAMLSLPQDVACDPDGNVVVTCSGWAQLIFLCEKSGTYFNKPMIAGNAYALGDCSDDFSYDQYGKNGSYASGEFRDGPIDQARFRTPNGVCTDDVGNIYVADRRNNLIRRINRDTGNVITLAGRLIPSTTGGDPTPDQLDVDGDGHPVWDGTYQETEVATDSRILRPFDVAWRRAPNGKEEVYVWEGYNPWAVNEAALGAGNAIRRIQYASNAPTEGLVTFVAGGPGHHGDAAEGVPAVSASIALVDGILNGQIPNGGIAVDGRYLYFCDTNNHKIRMIDLQPTTPTIWTAAGTTAASAIEKDAEPAKAKLGDLAGLAVDGNGNVYFCDAPNMVVRKLTYQFGRD